MADKQKTATGLQAGKEMGFFERYLTLWVVLCIGGGILVGKLAPAAANTLDGMALFRGL